MLGLLFSSRKLPVVLFLEVGKETKLNMKDTSQDLAFPKCCMSHSNLPSEIEVNMAKVMVMFLVIPDAGWVRHTCMQIIVSEYMPPKGGGIFGAGILASIALLKIGRKTQQRLVLA